MSGKEDGFPLNDAEAAAWGAWLKGLRDRAGLTQKQLAGRVGVDGPRIIAWEKGRHVPNGRHLIAILEACGLRLEETAPQPPQEVRQPPARTLLEQVEALTQAVLRLRDEIRKTIDVAPLGPSQVDTEPMLEASEPL